MSSTQVVQRYAKALFDSAQKANSIQDCATGAEALQGVFQGEVLDVFHNPAYSEQERGALIDTLTQKVTLPKELENLLRVLNENGRFLLVGDVFKAFQALADEALNISRAEIIYAHTLSEAELHEFQTLLGETLGRKVILQGRQDPALKAGYVIKLGNTVIDASLRMRLASLKESLSQGA